MVYTKCDNEKEAFCRTYIIRNKQANKSIDSGKCSEDSEDRMTELKD